MPAIASNPKCYHLSASAIAAFKACPTRFRLAYREGLRSDRDTESQRVGTNWHEMHETYAATAAAVGPEGQSPTQEDALASVVDHLNKRYGTTPAGKDPAEWALERQVLLTSFVGYQWYYTHDPVEVLASEVPFELPLTSPKTGLPLPADEVVRVGKIDHIVRWQGAVCALERKSTSRQIGADSDYWDKAKKDTQVSMYALAFRELHAAGGFAHLPPLPLEEGEPMPRMGNTLYDVWHKPTIKPAALTQKETAAFLDTKRYCGQNFQVRHAGITADIHAYDINGEPAAVEEGKKGFAIRETVDMFAARLLADIMERPDFYFQRREIARTDPELEAFQRQLYAVYQSMKAASKHGAWIENESACRATFPCPYLAVCYGPGADAVCDGKTTPQGYKRIFVDLTVNGSVVDSD